jgi:hypothetical protein
VQLFPPSPGEPESALPFPDEKESSKIAENGIKNKIVLKK